jgi:hypothetical protein
MKKGEREDSRCTACLERAADVSHWLLDVPPMDDARRDAHPHRPPCPSLSYLDRRLPCLEMRGGGCDLSAQDERGGAARKHFGR